MNPMLLFALITGGPPVLLLVVALVWDSWKRRRPAPSRSEDLVSRNTWPQDREAAATGELDLDTLVRRWRGQLPDNKAQWRKMQAAFKVKGPLGLESKPGRTQDVWAYYNTQTSPPAYNFDADVGKFTGWYTDHGGKLQAHVNGQTLRPGLWVRHKDGRLMQMRTYGLNNPSTVHLTCDNGTYGTHDIRDIAQAPAQPRDGEAWVIAQCSKHVEYIPGYHIEWKGLDSDVESRVRCGCLRPSNFGKGA